MRTVTAVLAALNAAFVVGCTQAGGSEVGSADHTRAQKETVRSADGTRIGFVRVGSGPVPVAIVHGALNSGENWSAVAAAMAERCTCYVMDRWGRGGSGEHPAYSLDREVEDIVAVLNAAGPDAHLPGHSSGAIYALEVARQAELAGLILYEPPLCGFHGRFVRDIWPRVRVAAEEERFEDVVSIFLSEEAEVPDEELSSMKAMPLWEQMVALAPQAVREWEELVDVGLIVERYTDVQMPTLLLAGTVTEDHPSFATQALQNALLDARVAVQCSRARGTKPTRWLPRWSRTSWAVFCSKRLDRSRDPKRAV